MKRIALYMFYDAAGTVADYVVYKLKELARHVDKIVVVSNGQLTPANSEALQTCADIVHCRENQGFDVWAYREGLLDVIGWHELANYEELLLLNYTFYAPIFPFEEMFSHMQSLPADFWGITAFNGPVPNFFTGVGAIPFHLQSHFIAVRRRMFMQKSFRDYWENMPPINSYMDSVLQHETRFTQHFSQQGFKCAVYHDPKKYKQVHPAFDAIDTLFHDRCPILKRRPFFHDPTHLERSNVELARTISLLKSKSDYDVNLIWKDVTRIAKPRDLYTNASLLEILHHEEPVPLRKGVRVGVLAHVCYVAMLPEMLAHLCNIPLPFDLFVTVEGEREKQIVEEHVAGLQNPTFKLCDVRIVQNRGRDVSALLVAFKDVVLNSSYDYLCRIHSKMPPQSADGMPRYSKENLYENLLANPAYVARLINLFELEPQLGIVMPPAVPIGQASPGHAWFDNRDLAEVWAERLGIHVPFDGYAPLAVYGTMWWCRPQALRRLVEYPFSWSDFPTEPAPVGSDLANVLERLIVGAAHQDGYYTKSVLTPNNAAKNYVNLEYKLQNLIGQEQREASLVQAGKFPAHDLKIYLNHRLSTMPRVHRAARKMFSAGRLTFRALRDIKLSGENGSGRRLQFT